MIRISKNVRTPALLALLAIALPTQAEEVGPIALTIDASIAANDRPADAKTLDASRKPAETLALLGLEPGMTVADVMTGTGYWADIIAAVVGPDGKVTALEPEEFYADEKGRAILADVVARNPNLTLIRYPFKQLALSESIFDAAILHLSYHDLYWQSEQYKIPRSDPTVFVAALYSAMRPGARLLVIDHAGPVGDTRTIVDKLHRIDPAVVRADFERAGFVLDRQSDHLANPADDRSKQVFDPAVRGTTDRFAMVFRKPV